MDKIKKVNNPLTIIAIFAGLAEIAGTIVLLGLPVQIQAIFVWFVMIFPISLVIVFFATLNWNHKVLYAPSDYSDETNFVNLLKQNANIREVTSEVKEMLDETKEITQTIGNESDEEGKMNVLKNKLDEMHSKLEKVNLTVNHSDNPSTVLSYYLFNRLNLQNLLSRNERKMFDIVKNHPGGISDKELQQQSELNDALYEKCMNTLINKMLIQRSKDKLVVTHPILLQTP